MVAHTILIAAIILVPILLFTEALPDAGVAVRAFFAAPAGITAPPPPPPPPPAGAPPAPRAPAPVQAPQEPPKFLAPIEVPDTIATEAPSTIDLGVEGGVPGGVEGGVPGGVVGGVVGGIPAPEATPPPKVVRVGGAIVAPKLAHRVNPEYPPLARQARVAGIVLLEAHVDTEGRVLDVKLLRGHQLLADAAIEAVKQWRYQPLLLNGIPTEFLLTVNVDFKLQMADQQ
jgi:protein TonB